MIKKVGSCLYAHSSNIQGIIDELFKKVDKNTDVLQNLRAAHNFILNDVEDEDIETGSYIIKVNTKQNSISFITCPTWDAVYEPIVKRSYVFNYNKQTYRVIEDGQRVYHHKWMFVSEDYLGFDIEDCKNRSEILNKIPEFREKKSLIGNKDYWSAFMLRYKLPIIGKELIGDSVYWFEVNMRYVDVRLRQM